MKFLIYYLIQLIMLNKLAEITDVDQIYLVDTSCRNFSPRMKLAQKVSLTCEVIVLPALVFNSIFKSYLD